MGAFHPTEPVWYLPLIGVEPEEQGRGYGAAMLRDILWLCDRDAVPAYLESSNSANLTLYRRHGFEQTGVIQAGSSPEMYPMIRRPR
jgi:GNAT superfamily N-acetyltransferase